MSASCGVVPIGHISHTFAKAGGKTSPGANSSAISFKLLRDLIHAKHVLREFWLDTLILLLCFSNGMVSWSDDERVKWSVG